MLVLTFLVLPAGSTSHQAWQNFRGNSVFALKYAKKCEAPFLLRTH